MFGPNMHMRPTLKHINTRGTFVPIRELLTSLRYLALELTELSFISIFQINSWGASLIIVREAGKAYIRYN